MLFSRPLLISVVPILLLLGFTLSLATPEYSWKDIKFTGSATKPTDENEKELLIMSGIAYDPKTRYLCAGFPAVDPENEVTIACFDTTKYSKGSSPVFDPFPTREHNGVSVRNGN